MPLVTHDAALVTHDAASAEFLPVHLPGLPERE